MNSDPKLTFMNVKLMTFEQLYDTDILALIERERQAAKVPFSTHPELAEKLRQAADFSGIHQQIEHLEARLHGQRPASPLDLRWDQIEMALRDPSIDPERASALIDELAEILVELEKDGSESTPADQPAKSEYALSRSERGNGITDFTFTKKGQ